VWILRKTAPAQSKGRHATGSQLISRSGQQDSRSAATNTNRAVNGAGGCQDGGRVLWTMPAHSGFTSTASRGVRQGEARSPMVQNGAFPAVCECTCVCRLSALRRVICGPAISSAAQARKTRRGEYEKSWGAGGRLKQILPRDSFWGPMCPSRRLLHTSFGADPMPPTTLPTKVRWGQVGGGREQSRS